MHTRFPGPHDGHVHGSIFIQNIQHARKSLFQHKQNRSTSPHTDNDTAGMLVFRRHKMQHGRSRANSSLGQALRGGGGGGAWRCFASILIIGVAA
mmetsp:Transcript_12106/g.30532  ORF Transcript_12106/g.30532 Transcript_12106/m.30532 type:complete len:95 (+) Transcript_12106:567-851(+)